MQILYINSDSISARTLHSEFLSYRGFVWDLTHCQSRHEAVRKMDGSRFDVVLYDSTADPKLIREDLQELVVHYNTVPVIALTRGFSAKQELELIRLGVHDTISQRYIDGAYIMRRIRMATTRLANLHSEAELFQPRDCNDRKVAQVANEQTSIEHVVENSVETKPPVESEFAEEAYDDDARPLRLLNVEDETTFEDLAKALGKLSEKVELKNVSLLENAESILAERIHEFDAVLVEQGIIENQQIDRLKKIRQQMDQIPFVMLIVDRSDFAAVSCIEQGYADCIVASRTPTTELLLYIRKAVARSARSNDQIYQGPRRVEGADKQGLKISTRRAKPRGSDRRRDARYLVEYPIQAIAISPDGTPDLDNIYDAHTIDFSLSGLSFKIPLLDRLPSRNWMIGVYRPWNTAPQPNTVYSNVLLRHISYDPDGIRIGAIFKSDDDFFSVEALSPSIDKSDHHVRYGLPRETLDQWVDLNILSKKVSQRAKVCPDCHAVVCIGDGCSQCGSANIRFKVLIHHFACAYVDDSEHFKTENGISCPKCLSSSLVVGADFELIKSRYTCCDCDHEGSETELVCACFHCLLRFPLRMAREVEVYRYDVPRLDILDILNSAK